MTTLTQCTSTIAWRITTCTEPARIVSQSLMITLTLMAQVLSEFHIHLHIIHVCGGCLSLTRPSPLSTSSPSSCPSSFPSSCSSTSSCSLSSSTRRAWKTCATPQRTRVRTLTASSTHPHPSSRARQCCDDVRSTGHIIQNAPDDIRGQKSVTSCTSQQSANFS